MIILFSGRDCYAQLVTLQVKNTGFYAVLKIISRKTGYAFLANASTIRREETFSINIEKVPVAQLLDTLFKNSPYRYTLIGKMVLIERKGIGGKVMSANGEPLEGVTVYINNTPLYSTDQSGKFTVDDWEYGDTLSFSYVGCKTVKVKSNSKTPVVVTLPPLSYGLAKVQVFSTGYQKNETNKKVGSYFKLEQDMARLPPIESVIEGRISGLLVTPTSGLPGSAYKMQLRGATSIGVSPGQVAYNEPLFVVDGFPYVANNNSLPAGSAINNLMVQKRNALANINVDDIESIEVVKDAEGAAIYGSRGANGVILINTKQGRPGQPTLEAKAWTGIGQINTVPDMLNTQQYLEARREAFEHDKIIPSRLMAPDLLEWDTLHYADFRKMLVTTHTNKLNLQTAVSGGWPRLQYYFSSGYNHETAFPSNVDFYKRSLHGHITYNSSNKKLSLDALGLYARSNNNAGINDLISLYLPPNIPSISNVVSDSLWRASGLRTSASLSSSYIFKCRVNYRLYSGLRFSFNLGYNGLLAYESIFVPGRTQINPSGALALSLGNTYLSEYSYKGLIGEPQLEYTRSVNKFKYTLLARTTLQAIKNRNIDTMELTPALPGYAVTINNGNYKYVGYFSRVGFQFNSKYQLNITLRREGSNRIRPNNRFRNFGAIGLGWIFSNDSLFKRSFPFINYGKLKAGYGIVGDDQVAVNYYANNWLNSSNAGLANAILPLRVTDEDYSWQTGRKLDLGIELALYKDRLFLSADIYRNRIGNQIIGYPDPARGLNALIAKNSSAIVQNKGLEIAAHYKNNRVRQLKWDANLILTLPNNKLLSFPDLESSAYANTLVINKSLSVQQGYLYTGVNRATGLFDVADLNKDGQINRQTDYKIFGDLDPKVYGSVQLGLNYKNWGLTFFLEGRVQKGYSLLYQVYANTVPGADMVNLPIEFLNRWHQPGDKSNIQRLSALGDSETKTALGNFVESNARLTDASYLCFRNVSLFYRLPVNSKWHKVFKTLSFYLTAENLFTITKYKGTDPETQNIFTLPPLTTLLGGIRFSF